LKGARGESIEENDDLDKEINLLKAQIESHPNTLYLKKNDQLINELINNTIMTFLDKIKESLKGIGDLFLEYTTNIVKPYITTEGHSYYEKLNALDLREKLFIEYNFIDFRLPTITFSLKVDVLILFENYNYSIYYNCLEINLSEEQNYESRISTLKQKGFLIKNLYHQKINQQQEVFCTQTIKKTLMGVINNKHIDQY